MEHIRPYSGHDARVVSDLSRFDYGKQVPRNRSRNVTPTEPAAKAFLDTQMPRNQSNMVEMVESAHGSSIYDTRDDSHDFYAGNIVGSGRSASDDFVAFAPSIKNPTPAKQVKYQMPFPNMPPKKHENWYGHRNISLNRHDKQDLPPVHDSRDYATQQQDLLAAKKSTRIAPYSGKIIMCDVLNKPILSLGRKRSKSSVFEDHDQSDKAGCVVTSTNIVDVFQIICAIINISMGTWLGTSDTKGSLDTYRFFTANGVVSLVIAILFVSQTINFEKKNGVVFCLLANLFGAVSLVLTITVLTTNTSCATSKICQMKKALAAFTILSFFFWIVALIVYISALYVSRMQAMSSNDSGNLSNAYDQSFQSPPNYNDEKVHSPSGVSNLNLHHNYQSEEEGRVLASDKYNVRHFGQFR